jgi:hypothetical protein
VPVIRFNPELADEAFAAYRALRLAERSNPSLQSNEHWKALVATGFARFRAAFERLA